MTSESEAAVVEDHEDEQERPAVELYVVNTVRRWETRGLRRRPGGKRHRFNLILCGGKIRLLRGKSRPLPTELFQQFQKELAEKMSTGQIDIRVGGPNGKSIGLPEDEELMEVRDDDRQEKDASEESQASASSSSPGVEASEGESEGESEASEEEVEEPTDDEPEEDLEADDEDEPEEEPELEEEEEDSVPEPSKPLERMNKAELIDYCVQLTGMDADDLEPMVKREILEAIQGALKS